MILHDFSQHIIIIIITVVADTDMDLNCSQEKLRATLQLYIIH